MTREEKITEICKQCNAMLGGPLANAIAHAISEGYKLGLEEKASRYDEALEKARKLCAYPTTKPFISDLQEIFPELNQGG